MAKRQPVPADIKKAEFEQYVRRSSDYMLEQMLEVAGIQSQHPDYMNRNWSGSPHHVPFVEVVTILNAEKKRRGIGEQSNNS